MVYDLPLGWVPIPFLYGSDRTLPIVKPPSLRRLQRVYFAFGEPIDTSAYGGDTCKSNLLEVRDAAQTQVLAGIHFLDQLRQEDSHRCVDAARWWGAELCLPGLGLCLNTSGVPVWSDLRRSGYPPSSPWLDGSKPRLGNRASSERPRCRYDIDLCV